MRIIIGKIPGNTGLDMPGMVTERIAWLSPQAEPPGSDHAEFVICDQTIDLTYVRLGREFVYLAVLMDVFTRSIRGWHLGRGLDQELTLTALQKALVEHRPEIHHSDQGVQYAALAYTQLLQAHGAQISMAEVGEPTQNGYAERLMRTIKEEEVDLSEYEDYHDAYRQIGRFLEDVYMHKRVHSSLHYLTPAEFESQWLLTPAANREVAIA
jgi:transposase InsO family protein